MTDDGRGTREEWRAKALYLQGIVDDVAGNVSLADPGIPGWVYMRVLESSTLVMSGLRYHPGAECPLLLACPSCGLGHGRRADEHDRGCPRCRVTCCTATCLREHAMVAHPGDPDIEERRDG